MKKSKGPGLGEWSLIIVYAALLAVCVNLTGTDMNAWLVNGSMFAHRGNHFPREYFWCVYSSELTDLHLAF